MSKQKVAIDWTKCPTGARYVAMDADGLWYAYEQMPTISRDASGVWTDNLTVRWPCPAQDAPVGFTGTWKESVFCRDGFEIQENVPSPLEDIVDTTERGLWCAVYVEAFKQAVISAKRPGPVDQTLGPELFAQVADDAAAEYRKRYGAEPEMTRTPTEARRRGTC